MKNFRLFFTILFLLISLVGILLIAVFDPAIFLKAVTLIKTYLWAAVIALALFLILLTAGIVSNSARLESSLIHNGYFQFAILELFLLTAALGFYWHYSQQLGQIILRLETKTTRDFIHLGFKYESEESAPMDTVRAPGARTNLPAGKYSFETLDQDIVYFKSDVVLEPGETKTLIIPVTLNIRTLAVQTDPAGAEIWLNGLQASRTPYIFEILTGDTVTLELKMAGYEGYTDTLCLNENMDLGVISLRKLFTVWISSQYSDTEYRIYDSENKVVFSSMGSRKLELAQGRYRLSYEIGEGQYDSKWFSLNYNSTVTIP